MSKQYDHVIELSEVTTEMVGDKPLHTVEIKVDDGVYARLSHEDQDILVNNARDIAHIVNFAMAFGVEGSIQYILNDDGPLTDMYSAGSIACSSILAEAEGVQSALVQPQDGTPMWGTVLMNGSYLDGKQVSEAARMVFTEFNTIENKEEFNLPESAAKALEVVTAEGWEPEIKLGVPSSPAPESISDVEKS